jgi:hypothetical protein
MESMEFAWIDEIVRRIFTAIEQLGIRDTRLFLIYDQALEFLCSCFHLLS